MSENEAIFPNNLYAKHSLMQAARTFLFTSMEKTPEPGPLNKYLLKIGGYTRDKEAASQQPIVESTAGDLTARMQELLAQHIPFSLQIKD